MSEQDFDSELEATRTPLIKRLFDLRVKFINFAEVAEKKYLILLRYSALFMATAILIASLAMLLTGLVRQIGTNKVVASAVTINANDVTPTPPTVAVTDDSGTSSNTPHPLDSAIRKKTIQVFRNSFKSYERLDTKVDEEQLIGNVWTEERRQRFETLAGPMLVSAKGQLLNDAKSLQLDALQTIDFAAKSENFRKTLVAYRNAKKVKICREEVRTKQRDFSAWDSYSTSCENWYVSPIGCSVTRQEDEPYLENVCEMKFPDNLDSPSAIFADAVERYANSAQTSISRARIDADLETAIRKGKKLEGQDNILSSGKLFVGFMALMLMYLLIVMERHHRLISTLAGKSNVDGANSGG